MASLDSLNRKIEAIRNESVSLWNEYWEDSGRERDFPEAAIVETIQAACTILQDPDDSRSVVTFRPGEVEALLMALEVVSSLGRLTEWEISAAEKLAGQHGLERMLKARKTEIE